MCRLFAGVVLAFSVLALMPGCALFELGKGEPDPRRPVVTGIPPEALPIANLPSYDGPHPSQLQRPAETFAFPIQLGQIGPDQPLFAGAKQYPFACDTERAGLGKPEIDNQDGIGSPIYQGSDKQRQLLGYSKDCLARTQAWYFYKKLGSKTGASDEFAPFTEAMSETDPAIAKVEVDGRQVPFIVRIEMGTINRFIYLLAALRGEHESLDRPNASHWNRRLIYQFQGGVGIGHNQGWVSAERMLKERGQQLAEGYAVIYSTGNATTNHYNIWLQEDTALRVKRQFSALYGAPLYTVGIGGSGGGLQQYLLAQNNHDLLDAGIAQYSYPDMVTQVIPVFDCELLEYYFDVTAARDELWEQAENRQRIMGYSADNAAEDRLALLRRLSLLANWTWPSLPEGQTECARSWRGLTPLVLNPRFAGKGDRYSKRVLRKINWSHFDDLRELYGTDAQGFARVPWDNVGVQYGLQALQTGQISVRQFLDLNARIGSWKPSNQMRPERYFGLVKGADSGLKGFSLWSAHNIATGSRRQPAPRYAGDAQAIAAAYRSGLVFMGKLDIPIIDLRHYLDPQLDMHHSSASFSARERILGAQGDAGMQSIWMSLKPDDPSAKAFAALDEWLAAIRAHPERGVSANRPASASDRCFDGDGNVLDAGDSVWDGNWNGKAAGPCLQRYPNYSNPRAVAGDRIAGDIFKCALQPIETAIARGLYGPVDMQAHSESLRKIFPSGVCDYSQPDQGRPHELMSSQWVHRESSQAVASKAAGP